MSQTVLSVEDLVVEYPVSTGTFRAVDSVSFSVDRGGQWASSVNPGAASPP